MNEFNKERVEENNRPLTEKNLLLLLFFTLLILCNLDFLFIISKLKSGMSFQADENRRVLVLVLECACVCVLSIHVIV